jgi:hypothetical protein
MDGLSQETAKLLKDSCSISRRPFQYGEDSMSRITYDLAVKTLMDDLPEFVRSSRSELQRAFSFINSLAEAGDDEVINLLQVSVLETLTDTPDSVATTPTIPSWA